MGLPTSPQRCWCVILTYHRWESYNHDYLERTFKIVEAFKNYPNTLLFFSANEVINDVKTAITVPYIRVSDPFSRHY